MELVYLWVEEYKNIHRQGFNFSPRFRCAYDPESNELTIDDNPEYIENFFGDNINVTAIVGKNGSGKSSLLSALLHEKDGYFLVYMKDDKVYLDKPYEKKLLCNIFLNTEDADSILINKRSECSIFFHHGGIIPSEQIKENNINVTDIKSGIFLLDYFESINISSTTPSNSDDTSKIFNITNITAEWTTELKENKYRDEILDSSGVKGNDITKENMMNMLVIIYNLESEKLNYKPLSHITTKEKFLKYKNKILTEKSEPNEKLQTLKKLLAFFEKQDDGKVKEIINNISVPEDFSSFVFSITLGGEYLNNSELFQKITKPLLEIFRNNKFVLDFKDEKKGIFYSNLSTGEQYLIFYLYKIIEMIPNIKKQFSECEMIYLLLDEPINHFHPDWQKKFLDMFINQLKINFKNIKFHLIFTTHSPFLLSDIPIQNIIFLDKNANGNCKVVDGLKEKKQTFGANIHTLLSDSFFMKDGLMGEFAKNKIEELIDFLNDKASLIEDNIQALINIIGEPIIRNQLQKMLDSKRLIKIDEIDIIKTKISDLEKRLKEIEDANAKS